MKKIGKFIVKARYVLLTVFALLCIISTFLMTKVNINYDMTQYLDKDSTSSLSLEVMQDEFGSVGQCQVMVYSKKLTFEDAKELSVKINNVDGVASVVFAESAEDTNYYKTENEINYALYKIFLTTGNYDTESYDTLDDIKDVVKEFSAEKYNVSSAYNGAAVSNQFLTTALDKDMVIILIIVAVVVLIILTIVSSSWIEPLIFALICVGAILINMGTNILLNYIPYIGNSMSFITKSIAAVMQLALSMDYAIVLLHNYREAKKEIDDKKEAMANAIARSIAPVSSSSLTTVAGLVALMFMSFSIGFDVGLVLAKGIVISLLSVFLFMPSILLILDPLLTKTSHKTIEEISVKYNEKRIERFKRHGHEAPTFSGFQKKTKYLIPVIAACLILCGAILNFKSNYSFVLEASTDKSATVNVDDEKITSTFGTQNTMVVLIPKENYTYAKEVSLINYLKNYKHNDKTIVTSYQGLTTYGINIPLTSTQTANTFNLDSDAVNQIYDMMKQYDNSHVTIKDDEAYITVENLINFIVKNDAITSYTNEKQTELDEAYNSYKNSLYNEDGSVNETNLNAMITFINAVDHINAIAAADQAQGQSLMESLKNSYGITSDEELVETYKNYKTLTTVITKEQLQAKYSFATDDMANYLVQTSILRNDSQTSSDSTMYYFEIVTFASINKVLNAYGEKVNQVLLSKQALIKTAYSSLVSKIYSSDGKIKTDTLGNIDITGDGYVRIILNLDIPVSGEESFEIINELTDYIYNDENFGTTINAKVVSETFLYSQIKDVFNKDIVVVNLISFFAILLIIAITFKGYFVPILLTALIQGAIWVTMGISTLVGQDIFFVCYIVVMCVQMGATIDYAILLTNNYKENRKTMNKVNAMGKALNSSLTTILTSGSILVLATLIIGLVSKVKIISDLGLLLSRGCLISVLTIIFCLPQFLILFDKVIEKTSYKAKFYNVEDAEFEEIKTTEE